MPILSKKETQNYGTRFLGRLCVVECHQASDSETIFSLLGFPDVSARHANPEKIESKFSELEAKEEAVDAKESAATVVISREDVAMTFNLEVGTTLSC